MQENLNKNNEVAAPKIELSLSEMQKKCLGYFNELSAEDKKDLDYYLNIEGIPSVDNFRVILETEESIEKLNTFLRLLARYKLSKKIDGVEAKKDTAKALKDIAKLF